MWKEFEYKHLSEIPPSKKPCFLAGTMVVTKNGLIKIEDIKTKDIVLTYNESNKNTEYCKVTFLHRNICIKYVKITTKNDVINATGRHLFYIPTVDKWIPARNLKKGMFFMNDKLQHTAIENIEIVDSKQKTYNLEVENNHNYFVSKDKILVHNAKRFAKSVFHQTENIEVRFYSLVTDGIDLRLQEAKSGYVGQTIQGIDTRFSQHKYQFRKGNKGWMAKIRGVFELKLPIGEPPYKMTPYEAAVSEFYEINLRGGKFKNKANSDLEALFNKQNPISKKKFEHFKKEYPKFNPCKYYV